MNLSPNRFLSVNSFHSDEYANIYPNVFCFKEVRLPYAFVFNRFLLYFFYPIYFLSEDSATLFRKKH